MFQSQLTERQLQSGDVTGEQSAQMFDNDVFLEVVGGISKKGRILGVGSHAYDVKESLKDSRYKDATSSEEVSILKDKVQTLTVELQELREKNIEQENIKRKVDRYEQMFERLMRNKNLKALLDAPEEDDGYYNEEIAEARMDEF